VGLELTWTIAPGYYLYRNQITATLDGRDVRLATPRGEPEGFGPYRSAGLCEVYRGLAMADTTGEQLPEKGVIVVTYKGCGQDAICYPPIRKAIDLATLSLSAPGPSGHTDLSATRAGNQQASQE
jgi:thiol:disulfide interchange protein DsbD